MAWTKRQIIEHAYAEIALSGHIFDLSPDEMEWARVRLDAMMANLAATGLHLGYAVALTPSDGDLDDDSNIALIHAEAVVLQLAKRLAGGKGKTLMPSTLANAAESWGSLMAWHAKQQLREQGTPYGIPAGAGDKGSRRYLKATGPEAIRVTDTGIDFLES